MRLYPRLHLAHAAAIASSFAGKEPIALRASPLPPLSGERFAPTGGRRVSEAELDQLRRDLDAVADAAGFPADTLLARQHFDRQVSRFLGAADLPPGEMLRAETWAWIAVHLVPHLVQWRFGGTDGTAAVERFAGPLQRNAIGRLWYRGWVFDAGPGHPRRFDLLDHLPEDATVAILERTTIASDHRLARVLAECWVRHRDEAPSQAEALLRQSAIRVRVAAVVLELAVLDDGHLGEAIERVLSETASVLAAAQV